MPPILSMPQRHGKSCQVPVLRAEPQLGDMLGVITRSAQRLTNASGAALAVSDGSSMVCRASSGSAPPVGAQVSMESGFTGSCVRTRNVQRCDDTEADPRVNPDVCRSLGIRSILVVPIPDDHGVSGLLEVLSSEPNAFDSSDVNSVSLLAALVQRALAHSAQQEMDLIPTDCTDNLEETGHPEALPITSDHKQALADQHSTSTFGELACEGPLQNEHINHTTLGGTLHAQVGFNHEISHISRVIEEGKHSSWDEICSHLIQELDCSKPQSVARAQSLAIADETNERTGGPLNLPDFARPLPSRKRIVENLLSWIKGGGAAL
jgi:putative methionine-R-sulfoxide reductase with GAF domain